MGTSDVAAGSERPPDPVSALAGALAGLVGPGATVLMVGPPLAGLGPALAARGCTITLLTARTPPVVEPWVSNVGFLDQRYPRLGSLPAVDVVVAPWLLDLAAEPATSLRHARGALRPDGRLLLAASTSPPPDSLHTHDVAQVERLCDIVGLEVQTVTVVRVAEATGPVDGSEDIDVAAVAPGAPGTTTTVVAAGPCPGGHAPEQVTTRPTAAEVAVAVDSRLRAQQAHIVALEEEVRALRSTIDHPRPAGAALARAIANRMRARG